LVEHPALAGEEVNRFSSQLYSVSLNFSADVAQLVEHFLGKEEVTGSIPVISS
jgi:hypothetical protein